MPWSTGRCPACGLKMGDREMRGEKPGVYRCRKCKTAIRHEGGAPGQGTRFTVVPHENGEMKNLTTIPRV